jgi:hypothetical protein
MLQGNISGLPVADNNESSLAPSEIAAERVAEGP